MTRLTHGRAVIAITALALGVFGASLTVEPTTAVAASSSNSPIVIGSISDVTGGASTSTAGETRAIQAWADWVNATGGVNGHKVKMIALDTQTNSTLALSEAKQLVEQDHIVALVGQQTDYDSEFASYMQQNNVPVIGGSVYNATMMNNPDFFPEGGTLTSTLYSMIKAGASAGGTKLGLIYCLETPGCAQIVPFIKQLSSAQSIPLVYTGGVSATAASYEAPCLAAKAAGANMVFIGDSSGVIQRIATSCSQQSYNPEQISEDGTVTSAWATTPALKGARMVEQDAPFSDTANPAIKQMQTELNKYAPGLVGSAAYGQTIVDSWASGLLFSAALKAANIPSGATVTSADITKGLYALKGATLGGIAPPLTFTKNPKGHQIFCDFVFGVGNGKFVQPQGQRLVCAPSTF